MEVTRDPMHSMPSHLAPQGSESPQLRGRSVWLIDFKPITASEGKEKKKMVFSLENVQTN